MDPFLAARMKVHGQEKQLLTKIDNHIPNVENSEVLSSLSEARYTDVATMATDGSTGFPDVTTTKIFKQPTSNSSASVADSTSKKRAPKVGKLLAKKTGKACGPTSAKQQRSLGHLSSTAVTTSGGQFGSPLWPVSRIRQLLKNSDQKTGLIMNDAAHALAYAAELFARRLLNSAVEMSPPLKSGTKIQYDAVAQVVASQAPLSAFLSDIVPMTTLYGDVAPTPINAETEAAQPAVTGAVTAMSVDKDDTKTYLLTVRKESEPTETANDKREDDGGSISADKSVKCLKQEEVGVENDN